MIAFIDPVAYWLLFFGFLLLFLAAAAGVIDWIVDADDGEEQQTSPWDDYPGGGRDGEPTDDDIYNGPGVEGGVVYDQFDGPGSLGENDWRL